MRTITSFVDRSPEPPVGAAAAAAEAEALEEVGPAARSYAVVQLRQPFTIAHARPEWDAERRRLRAGLPSRRVQCGDVSDDRTGNAFLPTTRLHKVVGAGMDDDQVESLAT